MLKKFYPIILIEIIAAFIYRAWLSFSPFAFGDAAFAFSETLKEYIYPSAWGIHGGPLIWKYPLLLIYGIIAQPGLDYNIVDKFTVLWPIIFLAPLGSFLLIKKITSSNLAGIVGSLVFSYNTYFLSIDTQGHELLTVAFALAPFAMLSFINLLENKRFYWLFSTVLLLFMVGAYDLRSLYVVIGTLFLYAIYHQVFIENGSRKKIITNVRNVFIVFFLLGLLSLFWLLPVISMNSLTNNEYLVRQLFGGEFYSLHSALTLFYPFWTETSPTWFYVQKIPFIFWLYPILALGGLLLARKNRYALFFGFLAIIGIFLTKQESAPFPQFYSWLYTHIPGFAAFREASKFYFLIGISYAVLIGLFSATVEKKFINKNLKYLFLTCLLFLPLVNAKPLITGEIKTMFVKKTVPQDFVKLNNLLVSDNEYSRVLGINLNQYYNFTTLNHPTLNALYSLRNFWGSDIDLYDFSDQSRTEGKKLAEYLNSDTGRRLLDQSSIGYIPVFIEDKQTNQNIRRDLGENRSFFEKEYGKINYLQKLNSSLENIILYKNKEFKPHIYITKEAESLKKDVSYQKVNFKMIGQSRYEVSFEKQKGPVYLNFTELYHPQWVVHVGDFRWYKAFLNKNYFLLQKDHFQNASRFNSFLIDTRVCQNSTCVLTVYFLPQSYLSLGLIISFIAFFIAIIFGVYTFIKKL